MKQHLTDPFRQQLQDMRAELIAQLEQQRGGATSRTDAAIAHFEQAQDSHAQMTTERETELAITEHELTEIEAIDAALQRMDGGHYGECVDCASSINLARLQAAPQALRCIHCQEKFEQTHPR